MTKLNFSSLPVKLTEQYPFVCLLRTFGWGDYSRKVDPKSYSVVDVQYIAMITFVSVKLVQWFMKCFASNQTRKKYTFYYSSCEGWVSNLMLL